MFLPLSMCVLDLSNIGDWCPYMLYVRRSGLLRSFMVWVPTMEDKIPLVSLSMYSTRPFRTSSYGNRLDGLARTRNRTSSAASSRMFKYGCDWKCLVTRLRFDNRIFQHCSHILWSHWWMKDRYVLMVVSSNPLFIYHRRALLMKSSNEWTSITCRKKTGTQSLNLALTITKTTWCWRRSHRLLKQLWRESKPDNYRLTFQS